MNFATPGGIFPTVVAIASDVEAFVLGHPIADGPVNMDYSIIFRVAAQRAEVLAQIPFEITGIACLGDHLFAVDLEADLHEYHQDAWHHWRGVGRSCVRINALRVVGQTLVGLGGDGMLYEWLGSKWGSMVAETPDLYLYDIARSDKGTVFVSGEKGFLAALEGGRLHQIDTGTNVDISCVLPLQGDTILLTGWKATILAGTTQELAQVDVGTRADAFANAVVWNGKPLVATVEGPLELDGLSAGLHSSQPAHRLATAHGLLIAQHDLGIACLGPNGAWQDIPLVAEIPSEDG